MDDVEQTLKDLLHSEITLLQENLNDENIIYTLIEIIRSIDYNTFMMSHDEKPNQQRQLVLERYKFGWALLFRILYEGLDLKNVPIFKTTKENADWIDRIMQHSGAIQLCNLLLDYKKADLVKLKTSKSKSFTFSNVFTYSLEYYEKISLAHYFGIIEKQLEHRIKALKDNIPKMRKGLESIVHLALEDFITYNATNEIDAFYSEFAYLYMMTTQTVDEYATTDKFGGYEYGDYLEIAKYIFRCGIMHRDCCMALAEKTKHKIWLRNILSYGFSLERLTIQLSQYLGWEKTKLSDILSCFTLNQRNYLYHIDYPKASPAPYIRLGEDIIIRSSFGSLDRPIFFLNKELQRKFEKDTSIAKANREPRFRKELYALFPQEKIIKVHQNIKVKFGKVNTATDIDAVIFDSERNVLALFQLKWYGAFYTSMKERFSRASNLINESVLWIDKVGRWIEENDDKTLLNNCRIDLKNGKIEKLYLFVISRNHTHFTDKHLDERAIWASWYQIIEAMSTVTELLPKNPISDFATKIKRFYPSARRKAGEFYNFQDYEFNMREHSIKVKM